MKKTLFLLLTVLLCALMLATAASAATISDLPADNWAYPYVSTLVDRGIMTTDAYGNIQPDVPTTRGEFVLYLWRVFGSPAVNVRTSSFNDIAPTSEYLVPVEWALENSITGGIGNNLFGPDASLTREQAFTFLYRATQYAGVAPEWGEFSSKYLISDFADYASVSDWAQRSIQLLMDVGIVTGSDTGYVWPKSDVNNAATATILCKTIAYMDNPFFQYSDDWYNDISEPAADYNASLQDDYDDYSDYNQAFYWYDAEGDVWFWNGYDDEFVGFGDEYYIGDDGNCYAYDYWG